MRYHVRDRSGQELIVPSLADLHGLYAQGFLEDEDLVRADNSDRWIRAGRMPALAGVRLRRKEPGRFQVLLLGAIGVVAVAVGAVQRMGILTLVLLVALVSIYVLVVRRRR